MGAHKLDIEFEDDDELKAREAETAKKKAAEDKHAADMGELEFDVDDGDDEEVAAPAAEPVQKAAAPQQQQAPQKQAAPQAKPQAQPQAQQAQQPTNVSTGAYMHASPGAANYNLGDELRGAIGGNRILEIELQAKVEIAVTHRLTTIIAENAQENKVLENKVNKILAQVAAKVPALKKELTMIKRLLAEHAAVDKEKFHSDSASTEAKAKAAAPAARPAPAKKKAS
ncbi:MAG: hypothetical protein ACJAT2_000962 [Bacteriovoracaceae bacterium]|jgi:hypothetical protein